MVQMEMMEAVNRNVHSAAEQEHQSRAEQGEYRSRRRKLQLIASDCRHAEGMEVCGGLEQPLRNTHEFGQQGNAYLTVNRIKPRSSSLLTQASRNIASGLPAIQTDSQYDEYSPAPIEDDTRKTTKVAHLRNLCRGVFDRTLKVSGTCTDLID